MGVKTMKKVTACSEMFFDVANIARTRPLILWMGPF